MLHYIFMTNFNLPAGWPQCRVIFPDTQSGSFEVLMDIAFYTVWLVMAIVHHPHFVYLLMSLHMITFMFA